MARSSFFASFALTSALAAACGGTTLTSSTTSDSGADASAGKDGGSGVDAVATADGGCIESPVLGAACNPQGPAACNLGDRCCIGYDWNCSSQTATWEQLGLGCACQVQPDASGVIDAASGSDAGASDAGDACGGCAVGDVCVVTTSSGGPCIQPGDGGVCPDGTVVPPNSCCSNTSVSVQCQPRPAACTGPLTCGCAISLCSCNQCSSASGSTVDCVCAFP